MTQPRYEFTGATKTLNCGTVVRQICSLQFIPTNRDGDEPVYAGEVGGWIEGEWNLPIHEGTAWVADSAVVHGKALVKDQARVSGFAKISGNAIVHDFARVGDSAQVDGNSYICGKATVIGHAIVSGDSVVKDTASVGGSARVVGCNLRNQAVVSGKTHLVNSMVQGNSSVFGEASVSDSRLLDASTASGTCVLKGVLLRNTAHVMSNANVSEVTLRGSIEILCDAIEYQPVAIEGLVYNISITDNHATVGCQTHSFAAWDKFTDTEIRNMDGQTAIDFIKPLRAILESVRIARGQSIKEDE